MNHNLSGTQNFLQKDIILTVTLSLQFNDLMERNAEKLENQIQISMYWLSGQDIDTAFYCLLKLYLSDLFHFSWQRRRGNVRNWSGFKTVHVKVTEQITQHQEQGTREMDKAEAETEVCVDISRPIHTQGFNWKCTCLFGYKCGDECGILRGLKC